MLVERRLLLEAQHLARGAHLHRPVPRNLLRRNRQRRQRHVGIRLHVVRQHAAVVHLVDVVARQNNHVLRLLAADRVDILVHRVRRPHVPVRAGPLHGRHQFKELAQFLRHNPRPPLADMPVQAQRLVLREHIHPAQSRIDAVRKRDVDNPVMPAKRHRRFGPVPREWKQPLSRSACKQYAKRIFHVHMASALASLLARFPRSC